MTNKIDLLQYFQPKQYHLETSDGRSRLIITGKKIGPPSKRITLHQKGLKVTSAKIIRQDKRGPTEHEVIRINHLPTFEQVRLHTAGMLYPGPYVIELIYQLDPKKLEALKKLGANIPGRDLMPSIDEPEAWSISSVEIISSSGK